MFAYCNNNPTLSADNTGNYADIIDPNPSCYDSGGTTGAVSIPLPLPLPGSNDILDEVAAGAILAVSYAYRCFTRSIKASMYGMLPGNYPVTHHIIPYGDFSTRSMSVRRQLHDAQEIMTMAGIYPKTDPINQLVLSASYHMSMHTDAYIMMVTAPIVALGKDATIGQIYAVLFDLRIIIASSDPYAYGY